MASMGELKLIIDAKMFEATLAAHVSHLKAMIRQASPASARTVAACVAGVVGAAAASPRKVSRRALFGLRARREP